MNRIREPKSLAYKFPAQFVETFPGEESSEGQAALIKRGSAREDAWEGSNVQDLAYLWHESGIVTVTFLWYGKGNFHAFVNTFFRALE